MLRTKEKDRKFFAEYCSRLISFTTQTLRAIEARSYEVGVAAKA